MSEHEKEINYQIEKFFEDSGGEMFDFPIVIRNRNDFIEFYKLRTKWQASRVTEEKILEIIKEHSAEPYHQGFSRCEKLSYSKFELVAKEILALIKGK